MDSRRGRSRWRRAALSLALGLGCSEIATPAATRTEPSPIDVDPVLIGEQPMIPIAPDTYAEPETAAADIALLLDAHARAQRELAACFPTTTGDRGLVLFCRTPACKIAFGAAPAAATSPDLGFATYVALGDNADEVRRAVVVTAPGPTADRILVHEWVHVHMGLHAQYDLVPTWFNEGVATLLAGEPSCAHAPSPSAGSLRDVATKAAWQAHLAVPGRVIATYCQSRAEIRAWVGGDVPPVDAAAAVVAVLDAVAAGEDFEHVYGRLRSVHGPT